METEGNFPKKVCCTVWGDLLNQVNNLKQGENVKASIDLESREYNERWYTDVRAWRIENGGSTPPVTGTGESTPSSRTQEGPDTPAGEDSADDLPF